MQGIGAALVSPAALALVTAARPNGPARARAFGWWTAAAAGGGASGWVLGGLLSGLARLALGVPRQRPLCAAAALLAPRVLTESRGQRGALLDSRRYATSTDHAAAATSLRPAAADAPPSRAGLSRRGAA